MLCSITGFVTLSLLQYTNRHFDLTARLKMPTHPVCPTGCTQWISPSTLYLFSNMIIRSTIPDAVGEDEWRRLMCFNTKWNKFAVRYHITVLIVVAAAAAIVILNYNLA